MTAGLGALMHLEIEGMFFWRRLNDIYLFLYILLVDLENFENTRLKGSISANMFWEKVGVNL